MSIGFLPPGHMSRPYSPLRMETQHSVWSIFSHDVGSSIFDQSGVDITEGGVSGFTGFFFAPLEESPAITNGVPDMPSCKPTQLA